MRHLTTFGLADIIGGAFSLELFSFAVAIPLAVAVLMVVHTLDRRHAARVSEEAHDRIAVRYRPEIAELRVGAALLIGLFGVENVLHGYVLNLRNTVEWWRYAVPEAGALLILALLLVLISSRGTKPPQEPVITVERRTWMSFAPAWGFALAGLVVVATVLTVFLAGAASSSLDGGPYVFLEIPVPNSETDPVVSWFFGWAYGVPVLLVLIALAAVLWATLRANAARPFLRADTVRGERAARRGIAGGALMLATGGILLALAGAWRLIADAGRVSGLSVGDASYDVIWQYAEFAAAAGWAAPMLEICAFVLLLVVAARPLRARLSVVATESASALAEVVR